MSVPFFGKPLLLRQPNGTQLPVRGWGNQYQAVFETPDGFTLMRDPPTGAYQYAEVSPNDGIYQLTGIAPGEEPAQNHVSRAGLRIDREAAKLHSIVDGPLRHGGTRWEARRAQRRQFLHSVMTSPEQKIVSAPPKHATIGTYVGLCILVQFPDVQGTLLREQVDAFCNKKGYLDFGNNGSVSDYFYDNSAGKLRYTNIVTGYYTARKTRDYYTDETVPQPARATELIEEALTDLVAQGFDFGPLTVDELNYIFAINIFYAGPCVNSWSQGLWPHSYHLAGPYSVSGGKMAFDYQISEIGSDLSIGTFCHENGHMVCGFPDLYEYADSSKGIGDFCLMCQGVNVDPKNPTSICAYLKYKAGWSSPLTIASNGLTMSLKSGENAFLLYEKNASEYFIVESRHKSGRDLALPDSGLAIWHVDELGDNNNDTTHFECALMQADGRTDLEVGANEGDATDLFKSGYRDRFAPTTHPASAWWDGTASSLDVHDISVAGAAMTFKVAL